MKITNVYEIKIWFLCTALLANQFGFIFIINATCCVSLSQEE